MKKEFYNCYIILIYFHLWWDIEFKQFQMRNLSVDDEYLFDVWLV